MTAQPAKSEYTACVVIIGNEILSGRTQDANLQYLAKRLGEWGVRMKEARVIPDIEETIVRTINEVRAAFDYVFTTGGIGPTHDDITADAIAKAFGVALPVNPEARAMLEARWKQTGTEVNEARLRMARIPEGASLIVNSVSAAPGFRIGNVHVMAGVPKIMLAMLEAIAPTLQGGRKVKSITIRCRVGEGTIGGPFGLIQAEFPDVKMGSYPQMGQTTVMTELVLRSSDEGRLAEAAARVREMVTEAHRAAGLPLEVEVY